MPELLFPLLGVLVVLILAGIPVFWLLRRRGRPDSGSGSGYDENGKGRSPAQGSLAMMRGPDAPCIEEQLTKPPASGED